ncbi:MAG: CocE/NonD family hydrolase [Thermoplasmatota archaeon]
MHLRALVLVALLSATVLAGCSGGRDDATDDSDPARTTGLTAFERVALPFNVTGDWSQTIVKGAYAIKTGEGHFVSVDLPLTEGGAAVFDPINGPRVHLGLFLPDVPTGTKVPVIADVGPYYQTSTSMLDQPEGDTVATEPAHRLGGFLIENFVPHGYAVAQVSVFGSGDSNHCFDMFGTAEQMGVDAAVTWLGEQEWSNGNVALIGRSYDGSTPWMAATFGNPHLKTIVPISGLHGLQALVTRNGTSEARAASFQNVVYGQFEVDGDAGDIQAVCPDALLAAPMGAGALVTGDQVLPMEDSYWAEREFMPRVLENYDGSVYFIHGLQDWNVDPHLISPAFKLLREQGLDVKGLFGQWGHMYPDRPGEHANLPEGRGAEAFPFSVRYDWAEDLKEWFDYYLKGEGPKPVLKVEVQDNIGRWRVEDTYPPVDVAELTLIPAGADAVVSPQSTTFDLGVPSADTALALSGHIYLNAVVTPTGADGQIHFTVRDADSGLRLAFGTMDLRHRGPEQAPAVPGQEIIIRVQSQPFDFVLLAGHRLELVVAQFGDGLLPSPGATPMSFSPAASQVLLPVLDRDASAYFSPPAWEGTAEASAPQP